MTLYKLTDTQWTGYTNILTVISFTICWALYFLRRGHEMHITAAASKVILLSSQIGQYDKEYGFETYQTLAINDMLWQTIQYVVKVLSQYWKNQLADSVANHYMCYSKLILQLTIRKERLNYFSYNKCIPRVLLHNNTSEMKYVLNYTIIEYFIPLHNGAISYGHFVWENFSLALYVTRVKKCKELYCIYYSV
jgi:hypothetical protein